MKHSEFCVNKTTLEMFYHWESTRPNDVYLKQPIDGRWQEYRWLDVANQVRRLASGLLNSGLQKGDRVALLSKNCAEWFIADLAMQMAGLISVPLYFDLAPENLTYVLEHSGSKAIFVGKLDQHLWDRLKDAIPDDLTKIAFSNHGKTDFNRDHFEHHLMDWVEKNEPLKDSPVPQMDDDFTIIYTSGTTGKPKGAVHTFHSPGFSAPHAVREFNLNTTDRFFSFLPLAHVAERFLVFTNSMYSGGQVWFTESIEAFQDNMADAQPTIFFAVPRLWKKFQEGVFKNIPKERLDVLFKIPLLGGIIKRKIRTKLGLNKARLVMSGAAPMSANLLDWYARLGISVQEAYGLTENFSYGCVSPIGKHKYGTIGLPMEGCGFKLSEEGEILFKSPTIFREYYKEPEKTADSFNEDGYFKTGDQGSVDEDGYITITGRFKEIFKTEKGEYVVPAPIENKALSFKRFEQVCVSGAGLPQPILVVQLTENAVKESRDVIEKEIEAFLKELNPELPNHEKLGGVVISRDEWTPDSGITTPSLKIKRNVLQTRYQSLMESVNIRKGNTVAWEA